MNRTFLFFLLPFLQFLACSTPSQSSVGRESLYAPSLSSTRDYTILLPQDYTTSHRYPVLFLLHGYGGGHEDWVSRTSLAEYVHHLPLIVVMPDAANSWYVNSLTRESDRFEDFIVSDLRNHITAHYSVDTTRMGIAGLSMGGYGAIMLALRHPEMFRFAGSLSGALSVPRDIDDREKSTWGRHNVNNLKEVFGTSSGPFRDAHDPLLIYRKVSQDRLPYLYFVMGTSDGFETFLPAHRLLTDSLRSYGAHYEYHEVPGGHSWNVWDRNIGPLVNRMMEVIK